MPDRESFLEDLDRIRKDAALLISMVWHASAGDRREHQLHQFHSRDRVEDVQADEALGDVAGRGELLNRK